MSGIQDSTHELYTGTLIGDVRYSGLYTRELYTGTLIGDVRYSGLYT